MATNQNNHLLDDAGNVAVDFVWGNFPLQPNDVRRDNGGSNLDYTLDSHNIAEDGWNGYPQYTPNTPGSQSGGVDYAVVPTVIGQLTADATDTLLDATLIASVQSAFTPVISAITLTSNVASVTATAHGYAVGDVVTIAGLTNGSGNAAADADLNGTYTITLVPDADNFRFAKTHNNITTHGGLSGNTAKVAAKAGRIKAQGTAAGTSVAVGTTVTITPYFAS
jgi:hypothetical protein